MGYTTKDGQTFLCRASSNTCQGCSFAFYSLVSAAEYSRDYSLKEERKANISVTKGSDITNFYQRTNLVPKECTVL